MSLEVEDLSAELIASISPNPDLVAGGVNEDSHFDTKECNHTSVMQQLQNQESAVANGYIWNSEDESGTIAECDVPHPILQVNQFDEHFFILSEAGKPIYSLNGHEGDFITLFGFVQALVFFVEDPQMQSSDVIYSGAHLQIIAFGDWKCAFVKHGPIILLATSRLPTVTQYELENRLTHMYYQLLSILTKTQIVKIFSSRQNYDLRKLLVGTEKSFQTMHNLTKSELALALRAVRVFPMPSNMREAVSSSLCTACAKTKSSIVFGLVLSPSGELITMVRMKKYHLQPNDLHLVLNMIQCNPSFKTANVSWVPICLPRFDDSGFLHAFISYISEDICLVLLTVDRNSFDDLLTTQQRFLEPLLKSKMYTPLTELCKQPNPGFKISQIGINDLWHFVFKNHKSHFVCSPEFEEPYASENERQRLIHNYLKLIHFTHNSYEKGPLRILYSNGHKECLLAWVREEFELYATLSPLVSKVSAISRIDKILKWLKKEEDRLFLMNFSQLTY